MHRSPACCFSVSALTCNARSWPCDSLAGTGLQSQPPEVDAGESGCIDRASRIGAVGKNLLGTQGA
jgi:hypothetical protein